MRRNRFVLDDSVADVAVLDRAGRAPPNAPPNALCKAANPPPSPQSAALVVTPHPISAQGQRVYTPHMAALLPGETLAAFLARFDVLPAQGWAVSLGGVIVPEAHWHLVRPKHGHLVEARRVMAQDVIKLVATVALGYFTFGAGVGAAGFLGLGTGFGATLAAGVAYMAGVSIINRLLPPAAIASQAERVTNTESPSYSLQGGRNRARVFEPMGLVLGGNAYCVPDLAAQPYTYFKNGEQFLNQALHAGINCDSVSSIQVGQTAIASYTGVTLYYDGMGGLTNTGLPYNSVDTVAGALLDCPAGVPVVVTRTSSANAFLLIVDLEGSLVQTNTSTGAYEENQTDLLVDYRQVGSATWLPFFTFAGAGTSTFTLANASSRPLRRSFERQVTSGQYEVRLSKTSANSTEANKQNTVQWLQLRTYQADTASYDGQSRVGVDIQASGQLNGSLDEVNWIAQCKPCPIWNGSAWVTTVTSNPGALMLLLARGIYNTGSKLLAGLGLPDAQIDIEAFKGFMVYCTAQSFTFDYFLQETLSIDDLMAAIAGVGFGAVSWNSGKFGVIWFAQADPIECVINMAAMTAKSFGVDYATGTTADEIEYTYFDLYTKTHKPLRVQAPGVTVFTTTARQRLMGVTDITHAAKLARFGMAQNTYQRKSITCSVDLEFLTFRRGTVVALSHDITQWGYGGRIQAAVNNAGMVTLTLDDLVPLASPTGVTTKYIGLRLRGEAQYRIFGCTPVWDNLLDYSEDLSNAVWVPANGVSVATNTALGRTGQMSMGRVQGTGGSDDYLAQGNSLAAGVPLELSFWVRNNNCIRSGVVIFYGAYTLLVYCNWSGTVLTSLSLVSGFDATFTDEGGGLYRVVARSIAGNAVCNVILAADYANTGVRSVYYEGVQLRQDTSNLLPYPQDFDNAAWAKNGCFTVTANAATAPNGASVADLLVRNAAATSNWADLTCDVILGGVGKNPGRVYVGEIWLWTPSGTAAVVLAISDRDYYTGLSAVFTATTTPQKFKFECAGPPAGWNPLGGYAGLGLDVALGASVYAWYGRLSVKSAAAVPYQPRPSNPRKMALTTAWPGGVPVPGDYPGSNPAMDSLWIYDFKATPGQKLRVTEIQPQGNMQTAKVTLVPESDEFWTYVNGGGYTAAPSNSLLPGPPVVSGQVVTEMLKRQGNTFYTELTLTFAVTGAFDRLELWGATGANSAKALLASTRNLRAVWQGGLAETWSLELRPYSDIHAGGVISMTYTVVGLAVPPPVFDTFLVDVQPNGIRQFNFSYASSANQPVDWLGAEIRYVNGTVPSPDWATMTPLQDATTYYTASPVEINAPLAGTWTFACKSLDTTGNESAMLVRSGVVLPDRDLGNVFDEFFEHAEGWAGVKTGCHVQQGYLEANDSTTWATLPSTWAAWTRWNVSPTSPVYYETPARDFGTIVAGQINSTVDADGTVLQELATSTNGSTWTGWSTATAAFNTRYIKLRLTVTATGPMPVPVVRTWAWRVNAQIKQEYINNVVISALTGSYRIGTGDVRIPLAQTYSLLKRVSPPVIQDNNNVWSYTFIDKVMTYGPRVQFRLNGTLADPAFVDFFVEGI